ncbi:MAG: transporter substrate-binding domain-containing protein [Cognatishimia activa]|uniref:Transporter substrate-binding domain-containing protein n=1 Tax=Cognatishimia activa TaxID=1715691 RepID=A0A975I7P1_9RHOB|nr:transporter substrate-binding domain-containing protein [Cognatishimia activa]QTN36189.1 transporter substrate-binding domain-containing protein [Cognatishimia activa]
MTTFLKLAGAATLAATFAASALTAETIRMGTEGAYPPYNFINDSGEIDGFEREVGDELCKRAGLECTWVTNEWDSIIPNLVSGNYDTIIAGMSITAERDEVIDFTQEYFPPDPSAYVALSGAGMDVKGGVVAAQTATIQAAYVAESGATLVEFATPEETVAAVRSGEADAVLADFAYLKPIVDASGGELTIVDDSVSIGGGVGMGIRESDGELKAKMDAAIASMKADGTLSDLIAKWFDGRMVKF